jgi:hypothetical protein
MLAEAMLLGLVITRQHTRIIEQGKDLVRIAGCLLNSGYVIMLYMVCFISFISGANNFKFISAYVIVKDLATYLTLFLISYSKIGLT